MTREVQPPDPDRDGGGPHGEPAADDAPVGDEAIDPAGDLLRAAERTTAGWLRRVTIRAAHRGGVDPAPLTDDIERVAAEQSRELVAALAALLATDVDEQRTNPLSLFRGVVGPANALLARAGATPPPDDGFSDVAFPDDRYRLGPASWTDIDDEMHEVGIRWGAWKAMTVLRRRRDEGRR